MKADKFTTDPAALAGIEPIVCTLGITFNDFCECRKANLYSADDVAKLQAENEALKAQLAASQAREQQLREALKALQQGFPQTHQINAVIRHTIALPQDDTALRQWGAKLLRDLADKGWPAWDADDLRLKANELEAGK